MFADPRRWWVVLGLFLCLCTTGSAGAAPWEPVIQPLPHEGKLVVIEDHRVPLIRLTAIFPVGRYASWWQDRHLDVLWPILVSRVETRTSAASIRPWSSDSHCGLSATFLRGERDEAVADLRAALTEDFDEQPFHDRAALRRFWRDQRASPSFALTTTLGHLFYAPTDPRRAFLDRPKPTTLSSEQVLGIRKRVLNLQGWVVGVAGDISAAEASQMVATLFPGDAAATTIPDTTGLAPLLSAAARPPLSTVSVPGTPEVLLAWARDGLAWGSPEAATALLADTLVQRRLRHEVRDLRADSYEVHTTGLLSSPADVYTLITSTSPERALEHAAAVTRLLGDIAQNGVAEEEVERARRLVLAQERDELHSPAEALGVALYDLLARPDDQAPLALMEAARAVPYAEVDAFARRFYDPSAFSQVRVVPPEWKKVLGPQNTRGSP